MNIKVKISEKKHFGVGETEELAARVLEHYCQQRFHDTVKTVNRNVRPIFYYCISLTGMDWQFFRRRWGVCENTYRHYRSQGEHLAMKTMRGRRFYVEMMTLLKTAIRERKFVTLAD